MEFEELEEFDEDLVTSRLSEIFSKTKKYLRMSTSLYPDFYNQEEIREPIEALDNKDVNIKILLDSDVDVEARIQQVPWLFDLKNAKIRQSQNKIRHLVISDGKNLRLEKPHTVDDHGGPNLIVRGADSVVTEMIEDKFETYWINSDSITSFKDITNPNNLHT